MFANFGARLDRAKETEARAWADYYQNFMRTGNTDKYEIYYKAALYRMAIQAEIKKLLDKSKIYEVGIPQLVERFVI